VVKPKEKGYAQGLQFDVIVYSMMQGLTWFIAGSDTVCCRFS
jgi:hypothetical protein